MKTCPLLLFITIIIIGSLCLKPLGFHGILQERWFPINLPFFSRKSAKFLNSPNSYVIFSISTDNWCYWTTFKQWIVPSMIYKQFVMQWPTNLCLLGQPAKWVSLSARHVGFKEPDALEINQRMRMVHMLKFYSRLASNSRLLWWIFLKSYLHCCPYSMSTRHLEVPQNLGP